MSPLNDPFNSFKNYVVTSYTAMHFAAQLFQITVLTLSRMANMAI